MEVSRQNPSAVPTFGSERPHTRMSPDTTDIMCDRRRIRQYWEKRWLPELEYHDRHAGVAVANKCSIGTLHLTRQRDMVILRLTRAGVFLVRIEPVSAVINDRLSSN